MKTFFCTKRRVCAFGMIAALSIAGCGSSSSPITAPRADDTASGASQWTTLGTRSLPSQPNTPITTNAGAQWADYNPPTIYPGKVVDANQYITMDDGIRLGATVAWPADANGKVPDQPLPVILTLTGYSKDNGAFVPTIGGANPYFLSHGYVHVDVDVRGTGRSDGQWEALSEREQKDYRQVVDWVVQQPWCNGNIGMYGTSLLGITSVLTASKGHPAVKAVYVIAAPLSDAYRDIAIVGGEGSYGFLTAWMSFVGAMGILNTAAYEDPQQYFSAAVEHVTNYLLNFQLPTLLKGIEGDPKIIYDTDFWAIRSPVEQAANIHVPVFIVSGLHDAFQRGAPRYYDAIKNQVTTKLLMGPWDHLETSGLSLSGSPALPLDGVPILDHSALMWFDQYVKGQDLGAEKLPNVTQWVWSKEHFVTTGDWPNPRAHAQRLFLHGDKSLSQQQPAADAPNTVLQEPLNGICSESADRVSLGILGLSRLPCFEDDRAAQALEASYDTAPMAEDFYFDGPIQADLWVSTTAQDTGLVVRVSDLEPGGTAKPLSSGLQLASLRAIDPSKSRYLDGQMIQVWHPFTQQSVQPVGSDNVVQVAVEVYPTSALIQRGHKLSVSVGASNFPYGLPPLPALQQSLVGVLSIYGDAQHPSSVVFPAVTE